MRIEYSRRALADIRKVSADSLKFGESVARSVETRLRALIEHIAEYPEAAQRVAERPGVHMAPLIRYPYKVFYRALGDRIRILHIRHTARRPWTRER